MNIKYLKKIAKKRVKETGISHMRVLHTIAKENGFKTWGHLLRNDGTLKE